MAKQKNENIEIIVFKDYYMSLQNDEERAELRNQIVPKYMSQSSFFRKMNDNSFTELEFEKLEFLTSQTISR